MEQSGAGAAAVALEGAKKCGMQPKSGCRGFHAAQRAWLRARCAALDAGSLVLCKPPHDLKTLPLHLELLSCRLGIAKWPGDVPPPLARSARWLDSHLAAAS